MRMRIIGAVIGLLMATPAVAWDDFGHMEVAQIAWKKLDPAVQTRVAQLLRINPQYAAWTVDVAPEKRDQIAFLRAATWADFIKSAPNYIKDGPEDGNRPPPGPEASQNIGYADMFMHKYWHFIDEPFSPDRTPLEPPTSPNAQTQIALFRKALASPSASDDIKSYDLVWLLHIVGDIHQPLHATSRFSAALPHGDNGGNAVAINCDGCQETSLHWFWDDTPGTSEDPEDAIIAANMLPTPDPRHAAVRDEQVWTAESFELAKQVVYQSPIGAGKGPYTLTDPYRAEAKRVARERIALAGTRLALLLNTAFAPPADPRLGCDTATGPTNLDATEPENLDTFKKRLLYYRCTAYEGDIAKVLANARRWVATRAPQVAHPAIVFDIDETSLLNWPRIYRDDYAYIPNGPCNIAKAGEACGDLDWQQSGLAPAVGPTLELYKAARCIDQPQPCTPIEVFFVTGRRQAEHNFEMAKVWTLRNLDTAGYANLSPDHLYMRDPNSTGSVADYKSSARADIESRGFTIIANLGDQWSDLVQGHADMTFKLPNPFYFIP
jgi:hypothetical protein